MRVLQLETIGSPHILLRRLPRARLRPELGGWKWIRRVPPTNTS